MRVFKGVCVLLLFITGVASSAQTSRAAEPYCDETSAKRVEITDADTTILGLTIGRTSLKDAQEKLGKAEVTRVSREEESDVSVCYVSPADGTVLVLYSGAMGGWKDITWFALWSREAAFQHSPQCTPSTLVSRRISTDSGLHLGQPKEQLERIVGKPKSVERAHAKYEYLCRRKMTDDEIKGFKANNWDISKDPYLDRMSWIEVRYRDQMASRIEVGEIESY